MTGALPSQAGGQAAAPGEVLPTKAAPGLRSLLSPGDSASRKVVPRRSPSTLDQDVASKQASFL